jgi:hypothetical protein
MMLWVDPTSAGDNTKDHYAEHTVNYEAAFFYSPGEYTNYLKKIVQSQLGIDPTNDKAPKKRLLDIGGGTGVFTRMLIENTNMEAIVIDPYLPSNLGNPTSVEEEPDLDENNIIYVHLFLKYLKHLIVRVLFVKSWQKKFTYLKRRPSLNKS